jgi:ABC-type thiamine transport system ATPase subunit
VRASRSTPGPSREALTGCHDAPDSYRILNSENAATGRDLPGVDRQPRRIVQDEPFGALDALTRERLNDDLLQLCALDRRKTVAFVTRDVVRDTLEFASLNALVRSALRDEEELRSAMKDVTS